MKLALVLAGMLLFVTLVTVILFCGHAHGEQPSSCFDELLLRWNQLAADSNRHIQTVEANPDKHRQMHDRIDREYAAVKALACW